MKYGVNTMVWTTRVGGESEPLFLRITASSFFSPPKSPPTFLQSSASSTAPASRAPPAASCRARRTW